LFRPKPARDKPDSLNPVVSAGLKESILHDRIEVAYGKLAFR